LDYLSDPKKYEDKFRDSIAEEAERNSKSLEIIFEKVKKELN
jgi:hypothetical protein